MTPPVVCTIAGSDSGGGAGIQADLRSFAALGTFGASVVTAVTAQNTTGVTDVHVLPASSVEAQLTAVFGDLPVTATKTGMLATSELVQLVARWAADGRLPNLVVDPVLVTTSGHRLLEDDAVATYRDVLLRHAVVATPNLLEAGVLVGRVLTTREDAEHAAHELLALGPEVVVVKGGHIGGDRAVDVVATRAGTELLDSARVDSTNDHGTGCTFAAATAAGLARGLSTADALQQAKRYVTACIASAARWELGAGHGPLDHLGVSATGTAPFGPDGWSHHR
jgi:hydroxymethylpyrimidine/phosphomethylpyrimidine kinase